MSTINVTNLSGRNGSPNLPDGAVVTGVVTSTSAVIGSGVTINAGGLNVTGVISATSYVGSGSGLTGVGESIAPWHYNPDVNDTLATVGTGIGITFNKKVSAGSGTATLKIVNAGVAGTTIQSWGVSSCTFNANEFTMGSLVSDLLINQTYQVDIPSGFMVDSNETSYAGTAYTFSVEPASQYLFTWGNNGTGILGLNDRTNRSSPTQIPGTTWGYFNSDSTSNNGIYYNIKTDGTLWAWGSNTQGGLGQNDRTHRSSPTQIGTDTTWNKVHPVYYGALATKTDGTLWGWGNNTQGWLGLNNRTYYSSPTQIPGTTWSIAFSGTSIAGAVKTDGTMWMWGKNEYGQLGHNNRTAYSSPVQLPGTNWNTAAGGGPGSQVQVIATKTNGTMWSWGFNNNGQLGLNNRTYYSSPVQIPGTTWGSLVEASRFVSFAGRTDGTLWAWGYNGQGNLGINESGGPSRYSSPVQIPGTNWGTNQNSFGSGAYSSSALKTDGTLWTWGNNSEGSLGQNNGTYYSSPTQIPGTNWKSTFAVSYAFAAVEEDTTP